MGISTLTGEVRKIMGIIMQIDQVGVWVCGCVGVWVCGWVVMERWLRPCCSGGGEERQVPVSHGRQLLRSALRHAALPCAPHHHSSPLTTHHRTTTPR